MLYEVITGMGEVWRASHSLLALLYFGLVSWAESPQHALDLFREDRWIVVPIRITSYNVCYTKLLRVWGLCRPGI